MKKKKISTESPKCPFGSCNPLSCVNVIARGWDFEYNTSPQEFDIKKCNLCGLIFLAELPVSNEIKVIYPDDYYSFTESSTENKLVKLVRDRLERVKGNVYQNLIKEKDANVIDIGCGDGRLLDILKCQCPDSWSYSGIEFAGAASNMAKSKGHEVREGDFSELVIDDWNSKFDLALMHQVIEHTRDPREVLLKAKSLLKINGVLSIETPDTDAWDFRIFKKRYWGGYHIPRHFFIFNKISMSRLAHEAGFEIISCKSILSPVFWIHSLHNWLVDRVRFKKFSRFVNPQNVLMLTLATIIEIVQVKLFRQSSNMQFLLKRIK